MDDKFMFLKSKENINNKKILLPLNTKNVFVKFLIDTNNEEFSKQYHNFIELSIKYNLKNDLNNLISKIKQDKDISNSKVEIDQFQHNLNQNVASKFLIKYYKNYKKNNVKSSFKDFVYNKCKNNKMKVCEYIKDLLNKKNISQKNFNLNQDLKVYKGGMYIDNYLIKCNKDINNSNNIICLFHKNNNNNKSSFKEVEDIENIEDRNNISKIISTNPVTIKKNLN